MIYIAHRGNLQGPNKDWENHPDYIEYAINEGFDVEIDVRSYNSVLYLGHDEPQYKINVLSLVTKPLWVHCKDIEALELMPKDLNYFYHDNDAFTLTSKGYIWCYPARFSPKGIIVHPESASVSKELLYSVVGMCSDNIRKWGEWVDERKQTYIRT